jgi:TRAP-type C4-dicarboxylate transport system substrate-binding protein
VKKLVLVPLMIVLAVSLILSGCAGEEAPPTAAPSVITLNYATPYMQGDSHVKSQEMFLDKVEEETNGRVQFQRFYAGTLIQNMESYNQVAAGVADLGHFELGWLRTGAELRNAFDVFFTRIGDRKIILDIDRDLRATFPEIGMESAKVKVLGRCCIPTLQLITREGKPVRTIADFSGLLVHCWGVNVDAFAMLNASPIVFGTGDIIVGLQKGTCDGLLGPPDMITSFQLGEICKYVTMINKGPCPDTILGMNWDAWSSLPAEIQQVLEDNIDYFTYEAQMDVFEEGNQAGLDIAEENGWEFIELSPADQEAYYEVYDELADREAAKLDDMGLPGTAIWKETQRLMKEYGVME